MLKRNIWLVAILAIVLGTLTFVACGKGGGDLPTGNSGVAEAPAPVASNPQPVTPPATGTPGILVERISSTFDADRCTDLSQPQHSGKTELVEVAKVTNNTTREVYAKPAIYHSDKATCGALDTNPGGVVGLMEAENIAPGSSKNWTHRFTIPERACGAYQFDNDAFNGEIRQSTLGNGDGGKVINTGKDCPSCEAFDVQLAVTGEGLTRTVSVTFKGQKSNVKATVDFGDGTTAQLLSGGSVSHTWKYGEFVVKATLDADGLSCYKSTTVSNKEQCQVEWRELKPEITYGEWGECKKPTETSQSTVAPECSQSRKVRTVIKEQNSCTEEIRVKSDVTTEEKRACECKKETCEDYANLKPTITGALSEVLTPTQVILGAGTVAPTGGTFTPTLQMAVDRPAYGQPAGQWNVEYRLSYGPENLRCYVDKDFSGKVPPKDCVNVQTGSFTVFADTHESGEYAYRVCTEIYTSGSNRNQCKTSTIVWQGWIPKGNSFTKDYNPDGKRLYLQVNLDSRDGGEDNPDGSWEDADPGVKAECAAVRAAWNERITYNCKNSCPVD